MKASSRKLSSRKLSGKRVVGVTPMWEVEVIYDADGTQTLLLSGTRISSQLIPDGDGSGTCHCIVTTFDENGEKLAVFHAARTFSILKKRRT